MLDDLSRKELEAAYTLQEPIPLSSAAGLILATEGIALRVGKEKELTHAILLDETINVLSLGDECIGKGKDFVWKGSTGQAPYFMLKDGTRQWLQIDNNTPVLIDSTVKGRVAMPSKSSGSGGPLVRVRDDFAEGRPPADTGPWAPYGGSGNTSDTESVGSYVRDYFHSREELRDMSNL